MLSGERAVKTQRFSNPKYIGDPINICKIFNDYYADELLILDISASRSASKPNYSLIQRMAAQCSMPVTYGGGISSLDDASRLFQCGVEKICIHTSAFANPKLISLISHKYGSQSTVVSVNIKQSEHQPRVFLHSTNQFLDKSWQYYLHQFTDLGAGEVLLTSVDREGTEIGLDHSLVSAAVTACNVPLIISGGASSLSDCTSAFAHHASAVAAGSIFVYHGPHKAVLISYPTHEEYPRPTY